MDKLDLTFVDEVVDRVGSGREKVLEILQAVQGHYGYLPKHALKRVCGLTDITPASITGVSTFYNQFRHRPVGRHVIHVCVGTACHVKGGEQIYDAFRRHLGIADAEDTDSVLAEGGSMSIVSLGGAFEPWRFWRFAAGPFVAYEHRWSLSMKSHLGLVGLRLAFYGGP